MEQYQVRWEDDKGQHFVNARGFSEAVIGAGMRVAYGSKRTQVVVIDDNGGCSVVLAHCNEGLNAKAGKPIMPVSLNEFFGGNDVYYTGMAR